MSEQVISLRQIVLQAAVLLTTREAARIVKTSPDRIVDLIHAGELAAKNIGRAGARRATWRIDPAELSRWLESRTTQPAAKPERRRRSQPAKKYVPTYF